MQGTALAKAKVYGWRQSKRWKMPLCGVGNTWATCSRTDIPSKICRWFPFMRRSEASLFRKLFFDSCQTKNGDWSINTEPLHVQCATSCKITAPTGRKKTVEIRAQASLFLFFFILFLSWDRVSLVITCRKSLHNICSDVRYPHVKFSVLLIFSYLPMQSV